MIDYAISFSVIFFIILVLSIKLSYEKNTTPMCLLEFELVTRIYDNQTKRYCLLELRRNKNIPLENLLIVKKEIENRIDILLENKEKQLQKLMINILEDDLNLINILISNKKR